MKIRASTAYQEMPAGALRALGELRARRNFQVEKYVEGKLVALDDYLRQYGLDTLVMGVSGGVDSAVVAGLARLGQRKHGQIKRIELLSMGVEGERGVTGQAVARGKAQLVANWLGLPLRVVPMGSFGQAKTDLEGVIGSQATPWAAGQGVAVLRSFMLYQTAALLTEEGLHPVVVGTTNQDEGSWLGYVGKASDGMVDLQIISDLYKSEVFQVARYLGVPAEIIQAVPTGDMFDGCPDTAVFGAPYEAVELLNMATKMWRAETWAVKQQAWPEAERREWGQMVANLRALHHYNGHKYHVGSPAFALDIMDAKAVGGRSGEAVRPYQMNSTEKTGRSVETALPGGERLTWINEATEAEQPVLGRTEIIRIPGLVTKTGVETLRKHLLAHPWQAADRNGNWRNGEIVRRAQDINGKTGGSWRSTWEEAELAEAVWRTLQYNLPAFIMVPSGVTERKTDDKWGDLPSGSVWRLQGVSPLWRAILYPENTELYVHYDSPFQMSPTRTTLFTLLIGLEVAEEGGRTEFIRSTGTKGNGWADWWRMARPGEVEGGINLAPGEALLFPHRTAHGGESIRRGRKLIIRGDVWGERVGVARDGN